MTERPLDKIATRPNPLITLIPLWVIGTVVMLVIGAVAVCVTASLGSTYHMTWDGKPDLLAHGSGLPPTNMLAAVPVKYQPPAPGRS